MVFAEKDLQVPAMTIQIPQKSALTVAVFYPGNTLMHQVSNWAGEHPADGLRLCFPKSVGEIRTTLKETTISIVDATQDPTRAMAAFAELMAESPAESVAVYTEAMHQGLELSVRSHGVLLLLGPMEDLWWEELFRVMQRCIARGTRFRFPGHRPDQSELPTAWLQEDRPTSLLNPRFRKIA